MKEIVSSKGNVWVDTVPDPVCGSNEILVQNIASVISSGTERDSIEVRKKSPLKILLFEKAKKPWNRVSSKRMRRETGLRRRGGATIPLDCGPLWAKGNPKGRPKGIDWLRIEGGYHEKQCCHNH